MTPFRKHRPGAPAAYYAIEAAGLRWLDVDGGPGVVPVLRIGAEHLELTRVVSSPPRPADYVAFGAQLARLHDYAAPVFGAAPAGVTANVGYLADLPLPYGAWEHFGPFYAAARLQPYLDILQSRGALPPAAQATLAKLTSSLLDPTSQVAGPPVAPSRIHGDLWSGNVMWGHLDAANAAADAPSGDAKSCRGWLIDPAAHSGHRETDLAMLALFGQPGLAHILTGYQRVTPLPPGWRTRLALHQVHPLLVHAVLFGGGYLNQAVAAATQALRTF